MKPKTAVNRNIFLWALYNFANTPIMIAMGGLFLGQWVIVDNKVDDIWYGGTFTFATILLLLTSPFLGAWSDKTGKRVPFLKLSTFLMVIFGTALGLTAISSMERLTRVILVLILFFFLQYFYQIGLIFYNALLEKLSTRQNRGEVSGISQFADEISYLIGNMFLILFSTGVIILFGQPGRAQVFIPAILVLVILGMPMFIWFKEPDDLSKTKQKISFRTIFNETVKGLKDLISKNHNITTFLISFMFISDALLTANLYFAIYMNKIFKMTDIQEVYAILLLSTVSSISAYFMGKLGDKFGIKKILMLSCVNLTIAYTMGAIISSVAILYVFAAFVGFGYGAFYTTSRAMLVKISPKEKLGEYFGFYSTFQRFASIIGPLSWGLVTFALKGYGDLSYRAAILSLCLLMLIGTLIMVKVKETPPI